jgi:hypothetical protein
MDVPLVSSKQPMKICVVVPTHTMVPADFMYDLANLMKVTAQAMPESVAFGLNMVQGTYVHSARDELLQGMIEDEVTHILWLDSDMTFPPDALIQLLQRQKPVVGINYSTKSPTGKFVALKEVDWEGKTGSTRLVTSEESTGVEEVEALGFGMVLMKTAFLKNLPPRPWFFFEWLGGPRGLQIGEDVYFCRILKEMGVPIYVDHDLSKECGHIGQFTYKTENAAMYHEFLKEQKGEEE